jgi:glycosyltransferase involved in cell wall biosynthesis
MRLMLVNYEYPPIGGGAGNASACIAHALARQGHDVVVVTSAFDKQRGVKLELPNLKVVRLDVTRKRVDRSNYTEMLGFVIAAVIALPRILREHPCEGLVVFFSLPCGPIGWITRLRSGIPYVISLRGGDVPGAEHRVSMLHRLLAPLRRSVLRNALAVVANSSGLARLSERIDAAPVAVIPNGVDTEFFSPGPANPVDSSQVRLLFAGRFQSQKNLFLLLDQFAEAAKRSQISLHLTLIGDGPDRAALHAHATVLGIADRIVWPGWLDKTQLLAAYRQADVFLNPSLYEGMPNTVLEAMACGLPVIASRIMGNEDLVIDGDTGLLFALSNPTGLSASILTLAESPARRAKMSAHARRITCERYAWDATAAQYASLFIR